MWVVKRVDCWVVMKVVLLEPFSVALWAAHFVKRVDLEKPMVDLKVQKWVV